MGELGGGAGGEGRRGGLAGLRRVTVAGASGLPEAKEGL